MNDLLGEVKPHGRKGVVENPLAVADIELGYSGDSRSHRRTDSSGSMLVEAGGSLSPPPAGAVAMNEFFAQVAELKSLFAALQRHLKQLRANHERTRVATRTEEMKQLREDMQDSIGEVGKQAKRAQVLLQRLDDENDAARSRTGPQSADDRTRTSITNSLRKKLRDILSDFTDTRSSIQEEYRETVQRRYFTVTGTKLEGEELEAMIDSGESESIFRSALMDAGRAHVLDTLADIQERHDAFKELERKLLELHQVFLDMAVLVEAQGEMLDNIEANVSKAVEYVDKGNQLLVSAKRIQRNTRKWACCALMILMAIIFIIVMAVLKPWETGAA